MERRDVARAIATDFQSFRIHLRSRYFIGPGDDGKSGQFADVGFNARYVAFSDQVADRTEYVSSHVRNSLCVSKFVRLDVGILFQVPVSVAVYSYYFCSKLT